MIALLGDGVGGAAAARNAGKGEFVGWLLMSVWFSRSVCGGGRGVCVP